MFMLTCLIIKEARSAWRRPRAYFRSLRSWIHLCMIVASVCALLIFIDIANDAAVITRDFGLTKESVTTNFQFIINRTKLMNTLFGCLIFSSSINVMHIFRFNRSIGLLWQVLRSAGLDMRLFFTNFSLVYFAFVVFFFKMYCGLLPNFNSFIKTAETMIHVVIGKFNSQSIRIHDSRIGIAAFIAYSIFLIFVSANVFTAILEESCTSVRKWKNTDDQFEYFAAAKLIARTGVDNLLHFLRLNRKVTNQPLTEKRVASGHDGENGDESNENLDRTIYLFHTAVDDFISLVDYHFS